MDEFTAALTAFQLVQRKTVELEKNAVRQARGAVNIAKPPGSSNSANNSQSNSSHMFEDSFTSGSKGQNQQNFQLQAQQEEVDLQALEEQERTIRELEVSG